jgi:hypothetical protein
VYAAGLGNRATRALLTRQRSSTQVSAPAPTAIAVSAPTDTVEQQAAAVAAQAGAGRGGVVPAAAGLARSAGPGAPMAGLPPVLQGAVTGGRALTSDQRAPLEGALGADLTAMRVHTGDRAAGAAAALGARAFTIGRSVVLGAGESVGDRALLAHEATHVLQPELSGAIPLIPVADSRAEQRERAAAYAVDEITIKGGQQPSGTTVPAPQPDARARARAADYLPVYTGWTTLGPDGRREQITSIINAQLARAGIPPVTVAFGARPPGSAVFAGDRWAMAVSARTVDAGQISADEFATLVDNAVHETQHVVTQFRAARVAMARNVYDERTTLPERVVAEARAANQRADPRTELGTPGYREALEIYEKSMRPPGAAGGPDPGQAREAVLTRRDAAKAALADARVALAYTIEEANNHPGDPDWQRQLADSRRRAQLAANESVAAHNAYVALPEEIPSWRAGATARAAVLERIALLSQLNDARAQSATAYDEHRTLRGQGDLAGARKALLRSNQAREQAAATQARLDALTTTQAREVGSRRLTHEVPLSEAEITTAPRAPVDPDAGRAGQPRPGTPRPTEAVSIEPAQARKPGAPVGKGTAGSNAAKAAATIAPGPEPETGARRTVVAGPGGGIGVDWAKKKGTPEKDATKDTGGGTSETGGGLAVGGDNVIGVAGRTVTPTKGDLPGTVTRTGQVAITKEGNIEAKVGRTTEVTHGIDARGQPITSSKSTTGSLALTDEGLAGKATRSTTSQTGTTRTLTGGATVDSKGNISAEGTVGVAGKSGTGVTTTFKAGHRVDAGDPVEVAPGVFEVAYTVTDSRAVGVGGSASRTTAGPSVGASVGSSSATTQTGIRRFTSKAEATRFKGQAALMLQLGGPPPTLTTVAGALSIPVGETRGSGASQGENWGVSGSYGATIGYGEQTSTGSQLSVRRVSDQLVEVTSVVSRDKGKDWSISGGITNTKGSSASSAFTVVYQFDLGTTQGQQAYELYTRTGLPMPLGTRLVSTTESKGAEDHDKVVVGPLGQAQWTGRTFESRTTSDKGVSKVFGGEQAHDQTPGRVGRWLGEDELHSSALLTSRQENGQEAGYTATIKIKSDSGKYNREEFGKIFMGAQRGKENAKPSGEWTLSAEVQKEVIHELEANSKRFRNAQTRDDKMRILSEIIKEEGARAAGGLVRAGGKSALAWTLELKGDENFPGLAGQQRLKEQHSRLDATLKTTPDQADQVVRDAKEAMARLATRRQAVARPDKYTDLPDELRQQQLALIDDHLRDFRSIHERGLKIAIKTDRGENAAAPRARIADPRAHAGLQPDQREADTLRDKAAVLADDIETTRKQIWDSSKAIHKAAQSVAVGVTYKQLNEQTKSWKAHIAVAFDLDKRQMTLKSKADELREQWNSATEPRVRTEKLRALTACLELRLELMKVQLSEIEGAAAALKPITTEAAMAKHDKFWEGIEADELSSD